MPRSFASSLLHNPLFIVSILVGIFPFRSVNGNLEVDKVLFCYSIFVAPIFPIMSLSIFPVGINLSFLPFSLLAILLIVHNFQYPCFLITVLLKRNLLKETVSSIQHMLFLFHKMDLNNCNSRNAMLSAFFNITHPLAVAIMLCITGNLPVCQLFVVFNFFSIFLGSSLCFSQFCFLLSIVCELYEAEITILKSMRRTVYRKRNIKTIEQLVETTNKIVSAARNIDSIYSFQHLFLILARFLLCIVSLFFIIDHASKSLSLYFSTIIGDVLLMFYHYYNSWKICHFSELASKKSKEFDTILYQLMLDDTTNEILNNDKLRLHISMKREVVFTACGFFNLDYTLVHSMIASATTYLVILIQFGQTGNMAEESPTMTNITTTSIPLSTTTYI